MRDRLVKCLECDTVLEENEQCDCVNPWLILISSPVPVDDRLMREVLKEVLHNNEARLDDRERELIQRRLITLAP